MHILSTLFLAAASLSATALAGPIGRRSSPAPLLQSRSNADLVEGKYIVVMNKDDFSSAAVDATISTYAAGADHVYGSTVRGFAATLDDAAIEELRNHPHVSRPPSSSADITA